MKIQISNISKSFGKNIILKDINLEACAGEILCLLGPSGAGKTTLIRLIIGAMKADAGTSLTYYAVPGKQLLFRHMSWMKPENAKRLH